MESIITVTEAGVLPEFGAAKSQAAPPAFIADTWKLTGLTPSVLATEIWR